MLLLLPKFDSGRDLLYNLLKQNVMAKSENVIRGRIGNMIFYRVRGVTRIRSVPLSVRWNRPIAGRIARTGRIPPGLFLVPVFPHCSAEMRKQQTVLLISCRYGLLLSR